MRRKFKRLTAFLLSAVMVFPLFGEYPSGTFDFDWDFDWSASAAEIVANGTCGAEGNESSVTWSLDSDGTLTISGTGAMADYEQVETYPIHYTTPWHDTDNDGKYQNSNIKKVVVEEGITHIGNAAFRDFTELTSISIPNTVKSIGYRSVSYCWKLESLVIPDSVTSIGEEAFDNNVMLTSVTIGNNVESIRAYAFSYAGVSAGSTFTITLPKSVTSIDSKAFSQIYKGATIRYSCSYNTGNGYSAESTKATIEKYHLCEYSSSGNKINCSGCTCGEYSSSTATLSLSSDEPIYYTGEEIKPAVTVTYPDDWGGDKIEPNESNCTYSYNINAGTATCTFKYAEGVEASLDFTIAECPHWGVDSDGMCDNCDYLDEPERVDEYYQIANAGNLMRFAQKVNEGQTAIDAKLTADIDMKDIDWTTMSSFAGTLDGNGHTILYLCADESDGDDDIADGSRCGLFQTLSVGGTVTNLTISGAQLWSAHSAGAIAAVNNGTISKCIVKDSSIMLGQSHGLAAIAGTNTGTVTDCGVVNCFLQRRYGAANSSTYAIGAVVEDNSGTVSNCFSYGCRFSNSPNIYAVVESGNTPVNCYYYTDATVSDTVATSKTVEAFASGEVAYLLNGSSSENVTWYQKLLTDTYPVLDSKHGIVYSVFKCDGETPAGYSNENKNEPHIDENGDEYCDDCGVIYNGIGAHLAGYSVSLNGSIGVNFHMDLTQDVLDDNEAYMLFTLPNGTTQKVMVSDARAKEPAVIEEKTYYIFTCNVAAKEMTDTIQAQLITSDGSKTQVYEYSVREYAERILSGSYDAETKELVKAMLHYGAYSQEWFDYNTTNLANAGLDTLDLSDADDWDEFNPIITNDDKVGSFTSAYLTLESDTAINLKFKLADGVSFEDLRVVVQDPMGNVVPATTDTTENVCLITLTGIKASDLDTTYDFSVTDGEGNESVISYSAMSYACAVANSEMDQKLKNVTAALRIFNLRANEKFEY